MRVIWLSVRSGRLGSFSGAQSFAFTRDCLVRLKQKAVRNGWWFKDLKREERKLLELTIRLVQRVRSFILAKNILAVVRKLESAMESRFRRTVREVGFPIARRLGLIAQNWGNATAKDWESDGDFAKYLAAMSINEPMLFRGC